MSAEAVRLFWERMEARDWDAVAARLDEGVVVDWPHTGERIRGRDNYLAVQQNYPEGWHIDVLRVVESDAGVVSEVRVDHGETSFYCAAFYDLRGGCISGGTEYWIEARAEEPAFWRARWTERT